jgi:hypothetical protein
MCCCPATADARARLLHAVGAAREAFEGDTLTEMWRTAYAALESGVRDAASERELILAVAVGVPLQLGGQAWGRAQATLNNVHVADTAVVFAATTIDAPISAAAAADRDTREKSRAHFVEWARLTARAGPGAARIPASARRQIRVTAIGSCNARPALNKAMGRAIMTIGVRDELSSDHLPAANIKTDNIQTSVLPWPAWGIARDRASKVARVAALLGRVGGSR